MGDKGRDSSLQKRASHTYTLRLGYSRISILYQKKKKIVSFFLKKEKNCILQLKRRRIGISFYGGSRSQRLSYRFNGWDESHFIVD